jgi:hypothetical protein
VKTLFITISTILLGLCTFAQGGKNSYAKNKSKFDGYLFAYFEGSGKSELQEQLRFATSADAIHWKALNNNQPIIPVKCPVSSAVCSSGISGGFHSDATGTARRRGLPGFTGGLNLDGGIFLIDLT